MNDRASLYTTLPETPGVYLMKDVKDHLLYVGKAANLRRRVSSYFTRPHDNRIQKLVEEIHHIEHRVTDTAIEALILEAELIKKYEPPFNIREKDGKSFLFIGITRDTFPRVLLVRGKDLKENDKKWRKTFGPFTAAASVRQALRILRRVFPFNTHDPEKKYVRPCFDYQLGLCPGVCAQKISRADYLKTLQNLTLFLGGEKKKIITQLQKEMKLASRNLEFEKAQKLQRQLFALAHIQDVALISDNEVSGGVLREEDFYRIEGYDISNISGTSAVGSMVVAVNGRPVPSEYRKFKIKTVKGANDVGMMTEVLERRFGNSWPLPQLILMDGGAPQVNAARKVLQRLKLSIPVIGLAKGPERKRNDVIGFVPKGVTLETLIRVRDEAHRFAISYHKKVRAGEFIRKGSSLV